MFTWVITPLHTDSTHSESTLGRIRVDESTPECILAGCRGKSGVMMLSLTVAPLRFHTLNLCVQYMGAGTELGS